MAAAIALDEETTAKVLRQVRACGPVGKSVQGFGGFFFRFHEIFFYSYFWVTNSRTVCVLIIYLFIQAFNFDGVNVCLGGGVDWILFQWR